MSFHDAGKYGVLDVAQPTLYAFQNAAPPSRQMT